jgi:hypothetical protein
MCGNEQYLINYLLQKVAGSNKEALQAQIQGWAHSNRLCHMHHPIWGSDHVETKNKILTLIKKTPPSKISRINVSVLFPPGIKYPLTGIFYSVMQK